MPTPPTQIGSYRIVRPLGQGGMGVVYEAIQEPIERRVALKVLLPQHAQDPDTLGRFFNEARAVNLIEHPGIVQVSDYGQTPDGIAYLVMEYLRGETLSSRLERLSTVAQRLPWSEAAQLAAQLADALTAAHDKAIVHRDLKPGNVMLVRDPVAPGGERAKILDFGIAKLTQGQAQGTATNALIGTPQYMSPEQCRGAGGVDGKTDVYALGVMLYEMLAGRPPFLGDNTVEYLGQHAFKEPPALYDFAPQAHPPLVALIQRLLVKDKALRPAMREVATDLSRLAASASDAKPALTPLSAEEAEQTQAVGAALAPMSTLSGSLGQTLKPDPRRRLRIVGAVVGTAVALGAFLVWRPAGGPTAATSLRSAAAPLSAPASPPAQPAAPLSHTAAPPAPAKEQSAPPRTIDPAAAAKDTVKSGALPPLVAKPSSSSAKPPAALRAPTPQRSSSESTPGRKPPIKARQVPQSALPAKPSIESTPASKPPKPTVPPVKRPVRYED